MTTRHVGVLLNGEVLDEVLGSKNAKRTNNIIMDSCGSVVKGLGLGFEERQAHQ